MAVQAAAAEESGRALLVAGQGQGHGGAQSGAAAHPVLESALSPGRGAARTIPLKLTGGHWNTEALCCNVWPVAVALRLTRACPCQIYLTTGSNACTEFIP